MENIMTWRDNELAVEALAVQGYYDEDAGTLQQEALAAAVRDVFLRSLLKASSDELVDKKAKLQQIGVDKVQLLDKIFPGFREKYELSEDEATLLKKNPKDHPHLEERDDAINALTSYLWGTMGKTARSGKVQELLVQRK